MNLDKALEMSEKHPRDWGGKKYPQVIYSALCSQCGEVFWTVSRWQGPSCSKECGYKAKAKPRQFTSHGYVYNPIKDHPRTSNKFKKVFEHILVMEKHLGRYLLPGENVHHKNGIKSDNRIENLELWVRPQLPGQRVEDLVQFVFDNYNKEIRNKLEVQDIILSCIKRIDKNGSLSEV